MEISNMFLSKLEQSDRSPYLQMFHAYCEKNSIFYKKLSVNVIWLYETRDGSMREEIPSDRILSCSEKTESAKRPA